MLYNYAAYKDCDLTAKGDLSRFPDGDSVQDWVIPRHGPGQWQRPHQRPRRRRLGARRHHHQGTGGEYPDEV